ncbi:DUF3800 domain-containing protein [Micromonospora aurantiaca (nom. illeg.)]|uniref:DUF3800 domain-containing protein n=1 Tax=Micromonospora aurantiaca (nom. illeg.) TaxID=47850 RepID=UPI0033DD442A
MLLTYVDESFTARVYWIGALMVPDAVAIPLTEALDAVMADAAKTYGVSADAELHGYEIVHGRKAWSGVPPRVRIAVYKAAMEAIGAPEGVAIILRGVKREQLIKRYSYPRPAHEVVLSHLLERVDGYVASQEEYALVIADEVQDQASHRADLSRYRVSGTGGYRSRKLTRIVDTLHFAPSHASRLVQAADLITYLFQRLELPGTDPRAARVNEQLWALVEQRRYHSWCWDPMQKQL